MNVHEEIFVEWDKMKKEGKGIKDLKRRIRKVNIKPLKIFTKEEIKEIRLKCNLTQSIFADVLGISIKTVEAWEAGRNEPNGSSARLLEMIEQNPQLFNDFNILAEV